MKPAPSKRARSRQLLVLTPEEKRTLCFVLLVFLLGLGAKRVRQAHFVPPLKPAVAQTAKTVSLPAEKRAEARKRKLAK